VVRQRLNQKNLTNRLQKSTPSAATVSVFTYDRTKVQPGIVHFGVGNFHRCHQAVYVDKLLSQGDLDWGIVGVSMRSSETRDQLAPQNFIYTQVTLSESSSVIKQEFSIIGSILNILVAPENPTKVINQLTDSSIKLVTTTITEKGYCLTSGKIDTEHPDFLADFTSLKAPKTIYGYIAAAAIKRSELGGSPLSVLCCDNIQRGGEQLEEGVRMLLQHHDRLSSDWAKDNLCFAASMVDRVAPASHETLKKVVGDVLQMEDAWPVSAEPFSQWVIQDNFAGNRPAFDKVGAVFTNDITLYEQTKLRFLNAGHSIISVLGYLHKQPTIHEALEQPNILEFALRALHENVLPVVDTPHDFNSEDYISDILERFKNSALPYTVQQVNIDSSQKIQQRWFPTIDEALAKSETTTFLSFALATWVFYIQKALMVGELNDPGIFDSLQQNKVSQSTLVVRQTLLCAGAGQYEFYTSDAFMTSVSNNYKALMTDDISDVLIRFLSQHSQHSQHLQTVSSAKKEEPHA
jgi:fructuronate reductase